MFIVNYISDNLIKGSSSRYTLGLFFFVSVLANFATFFSVSSSKLFLPDKACDVM